MTKNDIVDVSKKLSSKTRLRIIEILKGKKLTVNEIRDKYENIHKDIRRETVYRELEKLKESDLVIKIYDDENKVFLYSLKFNKLHINLNEMELKFNNKQKK